jgi:uncharacterized membrane protein
MQRLLGTALAVCGLLLGLSPMSVVAAVGLTISTPYPSVTVDPGGTATFDLSITTLVPDRVDLSVTTNPGAGWTTRLRGGGSTISAVYTTNVTSDASPAPSPTASATLEVTVPVDVAPGAYKVVLQGKSTAGVTETLSLDMTVEELGLGSVTMSTQNPVQRGRAGGSLTFNVTLKNDTNQETSFTLDAQGPADWDITAQPSGSTSATTFVVAAGASTGVTVKADSPDTAPAGQYPIKVTALGGPEAASIDLGVEITGSYSLSLDTADQRLNANVVVGTDAPINLVVKNTGSSDLTDVSLTATPPNGWTVTFAPDKITTLAANNADGVPVVATVHASNTAVAGDYVLTIRASSTTQGTSASDSVDIRTTVETSPLWGFIGIGLIVLVVVGLFFVFRQYGRR